jgi:hypothetical protein
MRLLGFGASILMLIAIVSDRVGAQIDEDLGVETPRCYGVVSVTGIERTSRAQALKEAYDAWMGRVRHDYGERYHDINYAEGPTEGCSVSTPVSPAVIVKKVYFRCTFSAKPCQVPAVPLERAPSSEAQSESATKPEAKPPAESEPGR